APAAVPAPVPAAPGAVAPAPQRPRDAGFFEEQEQRLRTLKRLHDNGLITDEEYRQKRYEVLQQL
ncbi:SHOCT domain-containing protein, partial [Rubrivivax gelatinosus]